ncbi:hypothetical protein D9M71_686990 [compost metagenome]
MGMYLCLALYARKKKPSEEGELAGRYSDPVLTHYHLQDLAFLQAGGVLFRVQVIPFKEPMRRYGCRAWVVF